MVNSIKLCGVIQMFGVDSFSHKVYRIVDLWLILVFFFKKSDIDRIFGVTLVSAKTRAVPTGESKFRAKTDVERISWSPLSCQSIAVCCCRLHQLLNVFAGPKVMRSMYRELRESTQNQEKR